MATGRRPGKGRNKSSAGRMTQAPGRMQGHKGHKSKGGKTTLTQRRWNAIEQKLLQELPKDTPIDKAMQIVHNEMNAKYRIRIVKGKI